MECLHVVAVEDDTGMWDQLRDYCDGAQAGLSNPQTRVKFTPYASASDFAAAKIEPDLLIADLRFGGTRDRSGWKLVKGRLAKKVIPVIVYSAFAGEEPTRDILSNPLVVRVTKASEGLPNAMLKCLEMKLQLNRARNRVNHQFDVLTLETAGALLGRSVGTAPGHLDGNALSAMAVSRLATYLSNVPHEADKLPCESCFIVPPLRFEGCSRKSLLLGDFLEEKRSGSVSRLWLVAGPSCDLVFGQGRGSKVADVLLVRCYRRWQDISFLKRADANARFSALDSRHKDGTVKPLKCPQAVFGADLLLLSFKDYRTVPYNRIRNGGRNWQRIATLATPYAESVQNVFLGGVSRIGTPDTSTRSDEQKWIKDFLK